MSLIDQYHRCGVPGCKRRIILHYFCCGQHRSLLGFDLSVRLQTAWRERGWDPERFERIRAQAYKAWGWQPERTSCPS